MLVVVCLRARVPHIRYGAEALLGVRKGVNQAGKAQLRPACCHGGPCWWRQCTVGYKLKY